MLSRSALLCECGTFDPHVAPLLFQCKADPGAWQGEGMCEPLRCTWYDLLSWSPGRKAGRSPDLLNIREQITDGSSYRATAIPGVYKRRMSSTVGRISVF